jgi:hypothetical protein
MAQGCQSADRPAVAQAPLGCRTVTHIGRRSSRDRRIVDEVVEVRADGLPSLGRIPCERGGQRLAPAVNALPLSGGAGRSPRPVRGSSASSGRDVGRRCDVGHRRKGSSAIWLPRLSPTEVYALVRLHITDIRGAVLPLLQHHAARRQARSGPRGAATDPIRHARPVTYRKGASRRGGALSVCRDGPSAGPGRLTIHVAGNGRTP